MSPTTLRMARELGIAPGLYMARGREMHDQYSSFQIRLAPIGNDLVVCWRTFIKEHQ